MPKYFQARTAREIRAFLSDCQFNLASHCGDDDVYSRKGYKYTVKIPSRDSEVIPIGTMSQIRKCIRNCGIQDKEILKWWKENGFSD